VTTSRTLLILTAAALITAGCGGSNGTDNASGSATSTAPSTVNPSDMSNDQAPPNRLDIDVDIKGGNVTPTNQQLNAGVKEQIIIRVNSDAADELHVHSTPEHKFNIEAKPMQIFQFTVDVPGRVDVELHKLNKTIATIQVQ
jgi:ABC-type glycerol-3-phosphate transport system substrate-binding protein